MDLFIVAMSRFKRRKYDSTIELCDQMLEVNPNDQAAWTLKCQSLTKKQYIDDLELDEEGVGDILLDDNIISSSARPGTSFQKPLTSRGGDQSMTPLVRPVSKQGRPITGFARPSSSRPLSSSSSQQRIETAFQGVRPGTNRPMTSGGRYLRLGTASLQQTSSQFLNIEKINLKSIAGKRGIAKLICDYLIYVEHNIKKAAELCSSVLALKHPDDTWYWRERLGKCYYMMGLHREAENEFRESLKSEEMIKTYLELSRIFVRLDQPNTALEILNNALNKYPHEISLLLGIGRIHDMLNDALKAVDIYRKVLFLESINLEAVASVASYHFYNDQPEVALRFYNRLVQLGVNNAELWNNMALCCFYDAQYDLFYSCVEKALMLAEEDNKAEIWYNISHIFLNIGDLMQSYFSLKIAISLDAHHAEAYNNLGVLEVKKNNLVNAKYNFQIAQKESQYLYEPVYNSALWEFNIKNYQDAYVLVDQALTIYPDHIESRSLKRKIEELLTII